jgi:hypothetical protein
MQFVPRALFALGAKATGENRAVATLRHEDMTGVENPFPKSDRTDRIMPILGRVSQLEIKITYSDFCCRTLSLC